MATIINLADKIRQYKMLHDFVDEMQEAMDIVNKTRGDKHKDEAFYMWVTMAIFAKLKGMYGDDDLELFINDALDNVDIINRAFNEKDTLDS